MGRDSLGPFEFQVLSVLMQHPRDAYGVAIIKWIEARTGKAPSVGALYTTLDRLEKKGFVRSSLGAATPQRGGRRKRLFEITASGERAVRTFGSFIAPFSPAAPAWGGVA